MRHVIAAIRSLEEGRPADAVRELLDGIPSRARDPITPTGDRKRLSRGERRRLVVTILRSARQWRATEGDGTIRALYQCIQMAVRSLDVGVRLTELMQGKGPCDFAEGHRFSQLATTVRRDTDENTVRTIHRAKGDEADAVLVYLEPGDDAKKVSRIRHILDPQDCSGDEERRVTYVELSRAKRHLYLCCDELTTQDEVAARGLGIHVVRL
jgi:hypothetical protein